MPASAESKRLAGCVRTLLLLIWVAVYRSAEPLVVMVAFPLVDRADQVMVY